MRRREIIIICVSLLVIIGGINILWAEGAEEVPMSRKASGLTAQTAYKVSSSESKTCIECHQNVTPGIVADWQESKHVQAGVSCFECHKAKKSDMDSELHNGFTISPIVSPKDCAACHPAEAVQFGQSLHAYAAVFTEGAGAENPLNLFSDSASTHGCLECHGTTLKITRDGDKITKIAGWPNNGIGRINPDGSKGSCTACHTRHTFSIAEARKPDTCGQCHLGPDHPQIEIYNESKHGNIYRSRGNSWNWDVPAGKLTAGDIGAPTCAVCHMSAFNGVKGTHDVSARLYWELETPISVKTNGLAADGKTPLRSFWTPADTNPDRKRADMKQVCAACHSPRWTNNYFTVADKIVKLYNKDITGIKAIYDRMKSEGLVDNKKFNEPADFKYFEAWHHEGRRMRFGAFMMGPDYEHWHGTYDLARDRAELLDMEKILKFIHSAGSGK
ncbi:MAG: hypothetical protein GXP33_08700 [Spirochaetes bacterium]|nr:hypothetical protein [Spirochaetota bacterium]